MLTSVVGSKKLHQHFFKTKMKSLKLPSRSTLDTTDIKSPSVYSDKKKEETKQ